MSSCGGAAGVSVRAGRFLIPGRLASPLRPGEKLVVRPNRHFQPPVVVDCGWLDAGSWPGFRVVNSSFVTHRKFSLRGDQPQPCCPWPAWP